MFLLVIFTFILTLDHVKTSTINNLNEINEKWSFENVSKSFANVAKSINLNESGEKSSFENIPESFATVAKSINLNESGEKSTFENIPKSFATIATSNTTDLSKSVIEISDEETSDEFFPENYKDDVTSRKKKKKKDGGIYEKILPMLAMPFILSAMMIPKMLLLLVTLMFKALIVGKIAIILGIFNMLRNRQNSGGVYSHNVDLNPHQKSIIEANYGHGGDYPEIGNYLNSWNS